ncbi:MAG TPA: hypothetical protein VGI67_02590 [Thermoleophilaceae bacterium]
MTPAYHRFPELQTEEEVRALYRAGRSPVNYKHRNWRWQINGGTRPSGVWAKSDPKV